MCVCVCVCVCFHLHVLHISHRDCPVVSPDGIKFGRLHVGLSYSNQKATTEGNPQPLQRLKATAVDSPKMMMKKGYSKDTSSAVAESSILIPDASSKCGIDDKRSDVGWREVGRGEEEEEEEEEARVKAVQLQVISDLIEKGQRLREAMVQASVKPWSTDGVSAITNLPGNHEDRYFFNNYLERLFLCQMHLRTCI